MSDTTVCRLAAGGVLLAILALLSACSGAPSAYRLPDHGDLVSQPVAAGGALYVFIDEAFDHDAPAELWRLSAHRAPKNFGQLTLAGCADLDMIVVMPLPRDGLGGTAECDLPHSDDAVALSVRIDISSDAVSVEKLATLRSFSSYAVWDDDMRGGWLVDDEEIIGGSDCSGIGRISATGVLRPLPRYSPVLPWALDGWMRHKDDYCTDFGNADYAVGDGSGGIYFMASAAAQGFTELSSQRAAAPWCLDHLAAPDLTTIACGFTNPYGIAVYGTTIVVAAARSSHQGLWRVPAASGPVSQVALGTYGMPTFIDASTIAYADNRHVLVSQVP